MNDFYFCTSVLAHGGIDLSGVGGIFLLIVMSLFVFGPLLFKATIKMPKGLFISSLISYVLILGNISVLSFDLFHSLIPVEIEALFFLFVYPYIRIVVFIEVLMEDLFGPFGGPERWIVSNQGLVLYLIAFIINTFCIFVIIRLFIYIRQHKKPQIKQAV